MTLPSANIFGGHYRYISDLLSLASAAPTQAGISWPRYCSSVRVDLLRPFLASHPDQSYAAYIVDGLRDGFHIGFNYSHAQLRPCRHNHPSCRANPGIISERLSAELAAGRLLGPIAPHHLPAVHVSPIGLVPKPHKPNKFRLIMDLSCPATRSVNDGIPSNLCSLKYASVDDAVAKVQALGRGTMLVKMDLQDAYRIVPVHPQDYHLLGVS